MNDELLALAEKVVADARGDEQLEAFVSRSRRTTAKVRKGAVESIEQATNAGVGIRVVVDGRQGFAYTGSLDADAISVAVAEARDNATFATPDEANGLAAPDGVTPAEVPGPDAALGTITTDRRVELALAVERAALATDARVTGVRSAEWSDVLAASAVASSTGIRAIDAASFWSASADVLATEGDDTQESYAVRVGRTLADLGPDDSEAAGTGREAAEKTLALLGATQPPSRRTTVVLDPHVVGSFLSLIAATMVGDAVLKGRSPFADRIGEAIAAPALTLLDDPTDPETPGGGRFDGEGLATRRNVLIDGGVLQGFLHSTWSGRKAGTRSTASAVRDYASTPHSGAQALALGTGALSFDDLLRTVGDGIWVQSVSGLHSGTNTVSGDFSVGIVGRVIRGGQLAEPIREATIASTLQRMLLDVVAIGRERVWLPGGTGSAAIAIEGVSLSGS
ncbi:MAG: peptidase family protein [Actinomycetia bacterium]|nr:peptidase family protein [Actinomycetes bacterium]